MEEKLSPNFGKEPSVKTVGFVVNPIAGMGGAVGLKGTDGEAVLKRAINLGAEPVASARAESFLSQLDLIKRDVRLLVGAGRMGEDAVRNLGFAYTVLGRRKRETTAKDTMKVASKIMNLGGDLLVFCGGDGTARDVLNAVETNLPVLGVPTGVKMHSAVFAVSPSAAALTTMKYLRKCLPLREAEVMDVDEEGFRKGRVSSKLYGYVLIPHEENLIQGVKVASSTAESEIRNQAAIAIYIIESMEPDMIYVVGPGTTTRTIGDLLDTKKTLLGVDLFCNKKLLAKDVNEKQILDSVKGKATKIIVAPIGGQGFIFGRGNQQISPAVIREVGLDNIVVIATERKSRSLKCLRVDLGDPDLDDYFRGGIKVITNYRKEGIMSIC